MEQKHGQADYRKQKNTSATKIIRRLSPKIFSSKPDLLINIISINFFKRKLKRVRRNNISLQPQKCDLQFGYLGKCSAEFILGKFGQRLEIAFIV
jgi:hypothetical protein